MSLIVGIICDGYMVLASGTDGEGSEMNSVAFAKEKVLLAQAGSVSLSRRVLQIFSKKAEKIKITHAELPVRILQESLREAANERPRLPLGNHKQEKGDNHFQDQEALDLTIAYYFRKIPHVFHISLAENACFESSSNFTASGPRKWEALALLQKRHAEITELSSALLIASSVVETVGEQIAGTGQPARSETRIGIIMPREGVFGTRLSPSELFNLPSELYTHRDSQVTIFFRHCLDMYYL